jgi:hypothetical protein
MQTLKMSTQQGCVPFECPAARIDLGQAQANDQVLFWTQSGCYSFLLSDVAQRRGQLCRHDGQSREAVWLGAVDGEGRVEPAEIRVGARAMFQVAASGRSRQMLTSAITRVVVIRQTALSLTR